MTKSNKSIDAHKKTQSRRTWGIKLLAIAIVLECVTAYSVPSIKDSVSLATSRQAEHRTELYFTTPGQLPKQYKSKVATTVAFSIHNVEGRDMSYPYAVYQDTRRTAMGSARVSDGKVVSVDKQIQLADTNGHTKITVRLLDNNQSISFWTEKK